MIGLASTLGGPAGAALAQAWNSGIPAPSQWGHWLVLAFLVALAASPVGGWAWARLGPALDRLADRRRALSVMLVGLISLLLIAGQALLVVGLPQPWYHDEYSYLLAGRTFAAGRLASPSPPSPEHFESFHILVRPTYASKYPPGQGLALALGIVLAGEPAVGVWLSTAAAAAAVCWALLAWVPGRWAILGGLLVALHPTIVEWSHGFWGGAVALLGGALVLGGVRRIIDATAARARAGAAAVTALGLAVLANSRPFEGVLTALPMGVLLLAWLIRRRREWRALLPQAVLPMAAVLAAAAAWMAYYNFRITGDPLLTPYALHDRLYNPVPHLVTQPLRSHEVPGHPTLAPFNAVAIQVWAQQQTPGGWAAQAAIKLRDYALLFLQPAAILLALLPLPWVLRRDPWSRLALACLLLPAAGILAVTWIFRHHYAAPAMPAGLALITLGLARLEAFRWRGRPVGTSLALLVIAACVAAFVQRVDAQRRAPKAQVEVARSVTVALALAQASAAGGSAEPRELIFVRYLPGHNVHREWVYNEADLDRADVVWAHDLGDARNAQFMRRFPDRRAWRIDVPAWPVVPRRLPPP